MENVDDTLNDAKSLFIEMKDAVENDKEKTPFVSKLDDLESKFENLLANG